MKSSKGLYMNMVENIGRENITDSPQNTENVTPTQEVLQLQPLSIPIEKNITKRDRYNRVPPNDAKIISTSLPVIEAKGQIDKMEKFAGNIIRNYVKNGEPMMMKNTIRLRMEHISIRDFVV